jgi:hypothetical protein
LWAAALAQAKDIPNDVDVPRFMGLAASVPMHALMLHRLAELLTVVAEGGDIAQVFAPGALDQPRGRRNTIDEKAQRYHILCAKGITPAKAAKTVGSTVATLKRHGSKSHQIELAMMYGTAAERIDGTPADLTHQQVQAYLAHVSRNRRPRTH